MRIEHLAIWVKDLEASKLFYEKYFHAISGDKYYNPNKKFSSYFLSFDTGCRLEIMHKPNLSDRTESGLNNHFGLVHFAISVGSKENVDNLTQQLSVDGYEIVGKPRTTGDGYYESVILDLEGNQIEITI